MSNIFRLAHQKGVDEGWEQGERKTLQLSVIEALEETKGGVVPEKITDNVYKITRPDVLRSLFRQAMRCSDFESFGKQLNVAMQYNGSQRVAL